MFLTMPGRNDVLTLNPSGRPYGFPGGCARESERELKENPPGVQGGVSHFGYMLPSAEEYERAIGCHAMRARGNIFAHLSRRSRRVCGRNPLRRLTDASFAVDVENGKQVVSKGQKKYAAFGTARANVAAISGIGRESAREIEPGALGDGFADRDRGGLQDLWQKCRNLEKWRCGDHRVSVERPAPANRTA